MAPKLDFLCKIGTSICNHICNHICYHRLQALWDSSLLPGICNHICSHTSICNHICNHICYHRLQALWDSSLLPGIESQPALVELRRELAQVRNHIP